MARKLKSKRKADSQDEELTGEPSPDETSQAHECAQAESLYSVLGLSREASQADIKKAYHRMALRLHPDKNPGDEGAKEKFQTLQHVFSILGDPDKRRVYDETGITEDAELAGQKFTDLYDFYRTVYAKITTEDISKFEDEYRGSAEELSDLKSLYQRFKGNMTLLFEWMMCSDPKVDSHRFKDAVEEAIASGELKASKAFRKWAEEVSRRPAPSNPLKSRKREGSKKSSTNDDLALSIRSKQAARADVMVSLLTKKYGRKSSQLPNKGGNEPEISDAEFAAIQDKLMRKSKKSRK